MTRQQQSAIDGAHDRRYFTLIPNLADDSDLDPYEFRLLAHYRRVAGDSGECREFTRTTAERCRMSRRHLFDARNALETKGWIVVEHKGGRGANLVHVTLVDRWPENMVRYAPMHNMQGGDAPNADGRAPRAEGDMHVVPTEEELSKKNSREENPSSDEEGKRALRATPRGGDKKRGVDQRFDEVRQYVTEWAGNGVDFVDGGTADRRELAACTESTQLIAEAYVNLHLGWWEDDHVKRRGSIAAVIQNLPGYVMERSEILVAGGFSAPGRELVA